MFHFPKDQTGGALVAGVSRGTPAEKAGLEPGDIIVEWNGQRVTDSKELTMMIARSAVGAKVPVKLYRNGKEMTLDAEVAERPAQAQ
jgi:S1-C subfamily serine protease